MEPESHFIAVSENLTSFWLRHIVVHVKPRRHANSNQQLATHWQDTFETKQSNTTTAMHTEWGGLGKRTRDRNT